MPIYHTMGSIPRKRHIAFRKPDGGIYAEELMGHEGFTGTASLLYHVHPPTTVKSARRLRETKYEADPDQTLRHRHFRTSQVKKGGSPTLDRVPLLFNMRRDPFERSQHNSNTYNDWFIDRVFIIVPIQALAAQFLKSMEDYPPSQTPGSFNLTKIEARLRQAH